MKDKRQRMALVWPHGVPDPHLYAHLVATAASYAYGMPSASSPEVGCISATGIHFLRSPRLSNSSQFQASPAFRRTAPEYLGSCTENRLRQKGCCTIRSYPAVLRSLPTSSNPHLLPSFDPALTSLLATKSSSVNFVPSQKSYHFIAPLDTARLATDATFNTSPSLTNPNSLYELSPGTEHAQMVGSHIIVPIATKIGSAGSLSFPSSLLPSVRLFRPFESETNRI